MKKEIFCILIIGLFFVSSIPVKATNLETSSKIVIWGEQIIVDSSSENNHFLGMPGITRTPNGTLILCFYQQQEDDLYAEFFTLRSEDNGTTWKDKTSIFNTSELGWGKYDCIWVISACPNGDILWGGSRNNVPHIQSLWRSQDDGFTWYFWRNVTELEDDNQLNFQWIFLYNKALYACMQEPWVDGDVNASMVVSYDNGETFSKFGTTVIEHISCEWSVLPLDKDGTWKTVNRDEDGWCYDRISYDNAQIWQNDITTGPPGQSRNPSLFWLDDEVAICVAESGSPSAAYVYWSNDKIDSWNPILLGYEGSDHTSYNSGVSLPKGALGRSTELGGCAYIVWTEEKAQYLKGCWIANNDIVSWNWPPGPSCGEFDNDPSPPEKPVKPNGPTSGSAGIEYTYKTRTDDPDGEEVYYWFEWGDNSNSGWIGPKQSGIEVSTTHIWEKLGNYNIRVKAKDINGTQSTWSDPLSISMHRNKVTGFPIVYILEKNPLIYQLMKLFIKK